MLVSGTWLPVFLSDTSSRDICHSLVLSPARISCTQLVIWAEAMWWTWEVSRDCSPPACYTVKEKCGGTSPATDEWLGF